MLLERVLSKVEFRSPSFLDQIQMTNDSFLILFCLDEVMEQVDAVVTGEAEGERTRSRSR